MQIHRLFEIVYLLLHKKQTTAAELARQFEVSPRTIYRDIDVLSTAGIPVYTQQGSGGGIFLDSDFVLNKSLLSEEEQNRILLALQSISPTVDTDSLRTRLGHLFQKNSTDWISVDFSRWGDFDSDRAQFDRLSGAILTQTVLTFRYASAHSRMQWRTVSPVKLLFKSKAWYLQAFCHKRGDYRLFKLTRMTELAVTGDHFDKTLLLPPPDLEVSGTPPPLLTVTLHFSPQTAYRLLDEFQPEQVVAQPDGSYRVSAAFIDDDWLYSYLLSFGAQVEVLAPAGVRDRLLQTARAICAQYDDVQEKNVPPAQT